MKLKNDSGHTALEECCGCETDQAGKVLSATDAQEMQARLQAYINGSSPELRALLVGIKEAKINLLDVLLNITGKKHSSRGLTFLQKAY